MTCLVEKRFTQTDPTPLGAGTAFEGSYVYSGNRPSVMVDLGGKRFVRGNGSDVQARGAVGKRLDRGDRSVLKPRGGAVNPIAGTKALGVGIPGTGKCFRVPFGKTKCISSKEMHEQTRDLGLDFLEKVAEAAGQDGSANAIAVGSLYVECVKNREDGPCLRSLIVNALELAGGGVAGFQILGGPAQGALFAVTDYTTDFAVRQLTVADETADSTNKQATLRVINRNGSEGVGSVRYWDGLPYIHQKGPKGFWNSVGNDDD